MCATGSASASPLPFSEIALAEPVAHTCNNVLAPLRSMIPWPSIGLPLLLRS